MYTFFGGWGQIMSSNMNANDTLLLKTVKLLTMFAFDLVFGQQFLKIFTS
jgi:hypothetical protein